MSTTRSGCSLELQVAPLSMFEEANTKTNLPAQIDMLSQSSASVFRYISDLSVAKYLRTTRFWFWLRHGNTYDVLYIAKGGGSANKTQLFVKNRQGQGRILHPRSKLECFPIQMLLRYLILAYFAPRIHQFDLIFCPLDPYSQGFYRRPKASWMKRLGWSLRAQKWDSASAQAFIDFVTEQVQNIGTAACPPCRNEMQWIDLL